jgi:hypothetical protein
MSKDNSLRKREPAGERTIRELRDALQTFPLLVSETPPRPPAPPGVALANGFRRMLNHMAETARRHAYSLLITLFLLREGVSVPTGFFQCDPFTPGSGSKRDPGKIDLGHQALCLQLRKALPSSDFSQEQFTAAFKQPSSWAASEIAKELIPEEYAKNREAARKKIHEAIAAAKQQLSDISDQIVAEFRAEDLVNCVIIPLLSGDFPLEQ